LIYHQNLNILPFKVSNLHMKTVFVSWILTRQGHETLLLYFQPHTLVIVN